MKRLNAERVATVGEAVRRSDIVTIMSPLMPETFHMFDSKLLSRSRTAPSLSMPRAARLLIPRR
jgi:lactate dehydrogenase-like 2-hydroxyacid dehydrogenase